MKHRANKKLIKAAVIAALFCVAAFVTRQDMTVSRYEVQSGKLNSPFRIALITDLHSCYYGEGQNYLLTCIEKQSPDIICLSGDIVDDKTPDDGAKELLGAVGKKYPCFYVSGNHESWSGELDKIKQMISDYGITVLEGQGEFVEIGDNRVYIGGVDDPYACKDKFEDGKFFDGWQLQIENAGKQAGGENFSVLLSHRPERTAEYSDSGFDLTLCGHAHGGQVRFPKLLGNGLYAPDQGILPQYTSGEFSLENGGRMIVSRGLCRNLVPRVFNRPELVIIDCTPTEKK